MRTHWWRNERASVMSGVVLLIALSLSAPNATAQKVGRGSTAPEIDLPTLTGGHVKLSALRGHPVVVTFWGTWCPPCRDEFPELVAMQKQHRDAGLVILAVNQRDQELTTKAVEDFVHEFGVDFPVALDNRGHTRRSFRLVGLPTLVFIDTAGVIQGVHPGPASRAEMDAGLAAILPAK
jgi:thiol-disulfide isomerase/thioredoxin